VGRVRGTGDLGRGDRLVARRARAGAVCSTRIRKARSTPCAASSTEARIEAGKLVGRIRFADTEAGRAAEGMVARGEITGISVGYRVTTWTLTSLANEVEVWRADRWELLEVSLVAVPADPQASIRSTHVSTQRADEAHSQENDDMRRNAANPETGTVPATPPAPEATRAAPAAAPAPAPEATRAAPSADVSAALIVAERTRTAEISATSAPVPAWRPMR
jgi:hypothetical protein